jgi:chemotaxis protein methyltransferase WspC
VEIHAVDISDQLLAKARRAVYGSNSFRGADLAFRNVHFEPAPGGHRLHEAIRGCVGFHRGNLLSPSFLSGAEPYDAIFCRNLLIYFDRETQERAIATLTRLLADDGVLFVGASEAGALLYHDFVPVGLPMSFGFRRRREPRNHSVVQARTIALPPARSKSAAPPPIRPPALPVVSTAASPLPDPPPAPALPMPGSPSLDEAYRLADQGHFVEAAHRCEEFLRVCGPSESAFYLLGLVRDATGNHADAESFYRKTLYLDPRHRDALAQLALLMDRQGKKVDAQRLRDRARRLERADGTS